MTLYVMIGLPGSGKSSFANAHKDCVVVCPDEIRAELYGDPAIQGNGAKVFHIAFGRINQALSSGHNVIFDATNVNRKARKNIFKKVPYGDKIAVFVNTPIEICKARNTQRDRKVDNTIIDHMAAKLIAPTMDEGWKKIIIST